MTNYGTCDTKRITGASPQSPAGTVISGRMPFHHCFACNKERSCCLTCQRNELPSTRPQMPEENHTWSTRRTVPFAHRTASDLVGTSNAAIPGSVRRAASSGAKLMYTLGWWSCSVRPVMR